MEGVVQCSANYVPLTPISFLERAARISPDTPSIIHGDLLSFTWNQTHQRCLKLASAFTSLGLHTGDVVATLASNIPELYELHFGVPMAGGVLSPLNPKLDAPILSLIFQELNPKFVFLQYQHIDLTLKAFNLLLDKKIMTKSPIMIVSSNPEKLPHGSLDYDHLLNMGRLDFEPVLPENECDALLVSYTSGTTGNPKGVVYSHRAAYLNTLGEILRSNLKERIVFLWTADMFRANGWGFTWAIPALGGTNVCLSSKNGCDILESISRHGVTHFSGHPSLLLSILEGRNTNDEVLLHKVYAHIAGTLPPPSTMIEIEKMGFEVVHRYGMTEVLGPPVKKIWKTGTMTTPQKKSGTNNNKVRVSTDDQSLHDRRDRIGKFIDNIVEEYDVKDPKTMKSVHNDGKTIGEIMFRGNTIMMGYLRSPTKTRRVFNGGWFHTGDLAVKHPDGQIQIKDRALDLIVNEGESISTLEIEDVLLSHPKVLMAAVVGMPEPNKNKAKYENECVSPCAFVKLRNGAFASEGDIIGFCKERLPNRMIPSVVIFGDLAISSTGKVQKFVLREVVKNAIK